MKLRNALGSPMPKNEYEIGSNKDMHNADLILVMKDGDIIESGNHGELLAKNSFYAELYNSQFEQTA